MNKFVIAGIVMVAAFIPAAIVAHQNGSIDVLREHKVPSIELPAIGFLGAPTEAEIMVLDEIFITGTIPRALKSTREHGGSAKFDKGQDERCHVRELVQGTGKVRICE